MIERIKKLTSESREEIVGLRRQIHANPELSFKEFETAKTICTYLDKIGVEYESGVTETGVVALIKGKNPDKKIIALRADMDALPIKEETKVEFKSANPGVMHACGHDVHTASLLGVAGVLSAFKDEFEGTVKLIFQPGEEKLPGGAKLMINDGVLTNPEPESIVGQHVFPDLPVGKVGFKPGMYMASADELYITVVGKGGHAALPHKLVDPILIASHIIVALQQIVSRNGSPYIPSVLSFGDIQGHGATNVIPNKVDIKGTFRTFDEKWRAEAHEKMVFMAQSIAESMGGRCKFEVRKGYPFLVNDEDLTLFAKKAACEYLGEENVVDLDLRMTSEDFAFFSQQLPSCFYRIGTSNLSKGIKGNLHSSTFNVDEDSIEIGVGLMSYIALKQLMN